MHTRDFLWSSLAILWVPDKTRSGGPYNETCEILARQLSLRELCQKHIVRLRQRRIIKTEHYASQWTAEMHHVRWKTPGACKLPRGELKQRTGPGSTGGCKSTPEPFSPLTASHLERVTSGSHST